MSSTAGQDPAAYTATVPAGRGHHTGGEARGEIETVGAQYGALAELARQSVLSLRVAQLATANEVGDEAHPGTHAAGRPDA